MGLGTQVVNLVGLHFLNDTRQVGRVRQVAVMQFEPGIVDMRILIDVVDPRRVELGSTPLDAVHLVSFFQKKFSDAFTNSRRGSGDQNYFRHNGVELMTNVTN